MRNFGILTLLILTLSANAKETLSDYYVMQPRENDLLYFIFPIEISDMYKKEKNADFDLTYVTSSPNVTMNMSIYAQQHLQTDSIVLLSQKRKIVITQFNTFYIEKEKQLWEHRYSCKIPFSSLVKIYNEESPWKLIIYSKEQLITYQQTPAIWEKEKTRMTEILYIIQINSKRE